MTYIYGVFMKLVEPEVGCWYKNMEDKSEFEVVAIDDDDDTIEIQYLDGELEEYELESWYLLTLRYIATPDCWASNSDDMENDLEQEVIVKPDDWSLLNEYRIDTSDGFIDDDDDELISIHDYPTSNQ